MRWLTVTLLVSLLLQMGMIGAAAAPQSSTGFIVRVLELTNGERHKIGLPPLVLSPELSDAAQNYSQVLASSGCFEHTCGPVASFADRVTQSGYTGWTALGENIAAGYPTPEAVVAGWMSSPGHRENIMSPTYTEMGIGLVDGGGQYGTYWTEEFGTRPGVAQQADAPTGDDGAATNGEDAGG